LSVVLACPRCRGSLAAHQERLACASCGATYGQVDGIPILVEALTEQQHGQRSYFDAEFQRYQTYTVENWRRSFIQRIFPAIGIPNSGAAYLDVGVGGLGATVIEAARLGSQAVGCDLSLSGIRSASRFAREQGVAARTKFVVCAAERLPFEDATFDCASAVAVLEHLDDDTSAARELARVVRPGARVWVTVPHAFRYMPPPVWPLYWWHDRRIGHKRHYTARQLEVLFASAAMTHVATFFSAHPIKLFQFAAARVIRSMEAPDSRLWWSLERLDRRATRRPLGALHLSMVFERR
jgi:ubiquinone/menaquinone biosynthesis C-methylase UbiE